MYIETFYFGNLSVYFVKYFYMYHVSDLKRFNKCPKLFYFDSISEKAVFQPYLRSDESFTDLLIERLGLKEYFRGTAGDEPKLFFDNYDSYEWFINSRMENNGLRIRIPVIHKLRDKKIDVYFVYYGTHIKELDFFSLRVQYSALCDLGFDINEIYYVHINPDYVFHEHHDVSKLFVFEKRFKQVRFINLVKEDKVDYNSIIKEMENNCLDDYESVRNRSCRSMKLCPYYSLCFPEVNNIEDNSILTLVSSRYKQQMYESGILKLKDADINLIEGNRVQYAQIMADKNGGLFVDGPALKYWLKMVKEPVSYIDFEWDRYLIPRYENMKPLDVIPFEYVLYTQERGELVNKSFLSKGDCRREFVESLINDLPDEGSILAYNADGAECLRLKELQREFPEYSDKLEKIISRFVDLAVPFVEGLVYDVRMAGNFSLKKLVAILSDESYENLDINEGMKAVYSWRDIDKEIDTDEEKTIEELKKYCGLDAYGLVIVYRWLREIDM